MKALNEIRSDHLNNWAKCPEEVLEIKIGKRLLRLENVLRFLPNKRLTCLANLDNNRIIVKLFFGSRFEKYLKKESSILKSLAEAKIASPKLLCTNIEDECGLLIIEYLDPSTSLSTWIKTSPSKIEFDAVLMQLTCLMLACHKSGFKICDPHLDNFLLKEDKIYIIDGGDVLLLESELSFEDSLDNLALLYSQFSASWDELAYKTLLKALKKAGLKSCKESSFWQKKLRDKRSWKEHKFIDKKAFRECSAYVCKKNISTFLVAKREIYTKDIALALSNLDRLIEKGKSLKDGGKATVVRVEIAGQLFVLKRYNIKNPFYAFIRGFTQSRAASSWRNGLLLEMLGIPVAKSYALIEERWWFITRRAYLLTEYIDGPPVWNVFNDREFKDAEKERCAESIYSLLGLLKRCQISHGDLKAQNIMWLPNKAVLIDLDGLNSNQNFKAFSEQFAKDIRRFQSSWPEVWEVNPYFGDYAKALKKNLFS